MFSHEEQLARLMASCPIAVDAAVIAGDPCFDRMLASAPLRRTYRDAFGVRPHQRLVVVSSTWGPRSLYGQAPDVVRVLREQLPLDEYAVAIALHPNTWAYHSPWQITMWLDDCRRAGVTIIPPDEGWRAALVAADLVVGDHGSVTFYGAALGRPTLLAACPQDAVDPASPIGMFLAEADRFDPHGPVEDQVRQAIERGRTHEPITKLVTSAPGESARLLRTEFYRLLDLDEPPHPALTRAVPVPDLAPRRPTAEVVRVELGATGDRASIVRHSASAAPLPAGADLVVTTEEPSATMLELADVVVHARPGDAAAWITDTLAALPGAVLATMPVDHSRWVVGTRSGEFLEFVSDEPDGHVWAAVVLAWLKAGKAIAEFPRGVRLTAGQSRSASRRWVASAAVRNPFSS